MRLVKVTPNSMHYELERGSGIYVARIYARKTPAFGALDLLRGAIRDPRRGAALLAMLPFATVTTLPNPTSAGVDTNIVSGTPTANCGTSNLLAFGNTGAPSINRTLINFNLAANIPSSATITSTVLAVALAVKGTTYATSSNTFGVYRVRRAWVEGTKNYGTPADGATWNTYNGTNNWGTAGCDNTTTDREATSISTSQTFLTADVAGTSHTATITGATVAALDLGYGWILIGTSEAAGTCYAPASSDHATAEYRPLLTVTYTAGHRGIISSGGAHLGKLL